MKTNNIIQLSTICIYFLSCVNFNLAFSQQQIPEDKIPEDKSAEPFLSNNETTTYNFLKLLQKIVRDYKIKNMNTANSRQDDDDDDFALPSYVPQIIKIVGSVISGNATNVVDSSLGLLPLIPGAEGSAQIQAQVGNIIEILANSISGARPIFATAPPRRVTTRRPTRRPPMRNRTRRTTTRNPLLNHVTTLNPTILKNTSTPIVTPVATSRPIIFVLPNIPNGASSSEIANNNNFLELVVNQSLSALQQQSNNVPSNNPQLNQRTTLSPLSINNLPQQINSDIKLPANQNPTSLQNQANVVSNNGNFTVITQNQHPSQEQLLSNLLNVLNQLAQPTTVVPPLVPLNNSVNTANGSLSIIPTIPAEITTTEDEYYYYYDDETTKAPQKGGNVNGTQPVSAVAATTPSGDDDDEDGAALIKAAESNQNNTKVPVQQITNKATTPYPKFGVATAKPITATVKPKEKDPEDDDYDDDDATTTTKNVVLSTNKNQATLSPKFGVATAKPLTATVKPKEKDPEEDDYDDDAATTPKKVLLSVNKYQIAKASTAKIPVIENDEEEAAAAVTYPPVKSRVKTTRRPQFQIETTEENEDEDDDADSSTVVKKNKNPTIKSTTNTNDHDDDDK